MNLLSEKDDKLKEAIQLCSIHRDRMDYAYSKLENRFPLTIEIYNELSLDELSFFDQLIFRFSKMQDCMGGKLFPAILEKLGEDVRGLSFIDILDKLEELQFLNSSNEWLLLRETRNIVTHEYPFVNDEIVDGLNLLNKHYKLISVIFKQILQKISTRLAYFNN